MLLTMLPDAFADITRYEAVENNLLMRLGKTYNQIISLLVKYYWKIILSTGLDRKPVVDKKVHIPSATMELYKSMLEKHTITNTLPLPGLFTDSANTIRTYINKGNH